MTRWMRLIRIPAAAVAVALVVLLLSQDAPPRASAVYNDSDGDGVSDLAEIITGSDPHNANSTPEDTGAAFVSGRPLCSDGLDNDGDGLVDAADPGCQDSDGDIISNAMETLLGSDPHSSSSFPEDWRFDVAAAQAGFPLNTCADGRDNDGDGLVDSADPGCAAIDSDGDGFDDRTEKLFGSDPANPNSVPEHEIPNPGSCSDGIDNDLDGLTDSADPGCQLATNDNFANATVISALPYSDAEKVTSATSERTDPPSSCFGTPPENVWYRYTAAVDGVLVADTAGTTGINLQTLLSVWTDRDGRLAEVACAGNSGLGSAQQTRVAFHAAAGETYEIQVGGYLPPQTPANLSFHLRTGTAPANDDFFSATAISALPFTTATDTSDATTEFNEPGCSNSRPVSTVWYRFIPSQDTLVLVDASPSNFSAVIGVWTPTIFGLAQVACSFDNYNGQMSARVAFSARAGQTYYLQAGGIFSGPSSGNVSLALQVAIPPANDTFAGATAVTSLPFTDTVDALTASGERGEPAPSCVYGSPLTQTVWYRYTATSNKYVEAGTDNTYRGDLIVAAYQGDTLANLREVACAQPYPPANRAAFQVVAGQTYYILVASQANGCCRGKSVSGQSAAPGPILPPIPSPPPPPGSPTPPPPSSIVIFHMDTLSVPTCAPSTFAITDPVGDVVVFPGPPPPGGEPPDITAVTGGDDGQNVCLDIQFAAPLPQPVPGVGSPTVNVSFDADELPGQTMSCFDGSGTDLSVYVPVPSGLIVPLYPNFPVPNPSPQGLIGYAVFAESSLRLIIPLAALGGDDSFHVTTMVNSPDGTDCAPDAGAIQSPFPPLPGDANCDGQTNSLDSLLILQLFANLIGSLPCQYAGDVNGNGGVGPIDALLILQYESGMLSTLPTM